MRVLLVEDSPSVVAYLAGLIRPETDMDLLPPARDGAAGVRTALRERPDVILMDLGLPVLDGIQAIRQIMASAPCPIVVLSAHLDSSGRDPTFEAFDAGAVDVLAKPQGLDAEELALFRERLLRTLRVMAGACVVRRRSTAGQPRRVERPLPARGARFDILAIGSSVGGPMVLREIFRAIPPPSPLPIVVSQHIIPGFEAGLARWLAGTGHRVVVAKDGDRIGGGIVYLAPGDRHMALRGESIELLPDEGGGPVPSADVLFRSAAASFGPHAAALLLSGMGQDGAQGMLALRKAGGVTITQSGGTCVVDGMPAAARALGASLFELDPSEMAAWLNGIGRLLDLAATSASPPFAAKARRPER